MEPPLVNWIKINSDASLGTHGTAGIGGACRDHKGTVVKAFSSFFLHETIDVELAEAIACREGVLWAIRLGFKAVVLEMDNLSIVSLLQKKSIPRSRVGTIVADILLLVQSFDCVSFGWARRSCNGLANEIARLARNPSTLAPCNATASCCT